MSGSSRNGGWFARLRSLRLVREDFEDGGATLVRYIETHDMKYNRHVGAHFLRALHGAGPEVLESFANRQRLYGWHFDLTPAEEAALRRARDATCAVTRIANLRYGTNVFLQLANPKQLGRMLGLGLVAGSAGVLLALGEVFLFAKEATRRFLEDHFGFSFADEAARDKAEFVALAEEIAKGAVTPSGDLDAGIVAERIEDLVRAIENAGSADTALQVATRDWTYLIGVVSGIVLLIVGRGVVKLVLEGFTGAIAKIDAVIDDMDAYCEWRLGRAPYPPESPFLRGDVLRQSPTGIERP
ncbi:MAG: hypothetical protein AAFN79_09895 [Pseudomonadota bacterium]